MTSHNPDQAVTIRLLPSSNRAKCRHPTGTRLTPIKDRTRTEQVPDQDHVERSITVQGPNKYRTVSASYCDRAVTVHGPSPHLDRTMHGPCKDRAGTIQRPCCNRSVTVPSPCDCNRTVTILSPSFCRKMHAVCRTVLRFAAGNNSNCAQDCRLSALEAKLHSCYCRCMVLLLTLYAA